MSFSQQSRHRPVAGPRRAFLAPPVHRTPGAARRVFPASLLLPALLTLPLLTAPAPLAAQLSRASMTSFPAGAPQVSEEIRPRFHVGGGVAVAQPVGEFREYVSVGGGIQAFARLEADEAGRVALRIQGSVLTYGQETQRVCLSATVGCRIQVDLVTSNNIFLVGVGPELALPIGSSRLYGTALVGLGYFSTDSEVRGTGDQDPFASTRNFSDGGLAWSAGGGLEIPIARARRAPVSLDLGLSYQGNGRREYLTRGGIRDLPDGSLEFDVLRSDADFLIWRIGVSVKLPLHEY